MEGIYIYQRGWRGDDRPRVGYIGRYSKDGECGCCGGESLELVILRGRLYVCRV